MVKSHRPQMSSSLSHLPFLTHLFLLFLLVHVLVSFFLLPFASPAEPCKFPSEWTGLWFQKGSGPDPIEITASEISEKGTCREISGDKYLVENRQERCVRCMVINQKHSNVLQYKESFCFTYGRHRNLRDVCAEMNGDASLYSLFRVNTPPVPCPFTGPFKFTYSRGSGECREPMSSVESCTDDSHLLFRFQACADVSGSESRVEELSCLGEWKEGSLRYLVGRMTHPAAKSDEDIFRCFVLEKNKKSNDSYSLAQSGDATCDGLSSAIEGSRTMKLTKTPAITASCTFPKWLTGPRHWKTLEGSKILDFSRNSSFIVYDTDSAAKLRIATCVRQQEALFSLNHRSTSFRSSSIHTSHHTSHGQVSSHIDSPSFIHTASPSSPSSASSSLSSSSPSSSLDVNRGGNLNSSPYVEYVIHSVAGCKIGYMCIRIHKRNNHVIEIESGSQLMVKDVADASCSSNQYTSFLTITTFNPKLEDCPIEGIYSVNMPASLSTSSEEDTSTPASSSLISPASSSLFNSFSSFSSPSFSSLSPSSPFHLEDASSGLYFCSEQSFLTSRCNTPAHMQLLTQCPSSQSAPAAVISPSASGINSETASFSSSSSMSKERSTTVASGGGGGGGGSSNSVDSMQRNFYCHGNWHLNGLKYTVVSSSEDRRQYCLTYTDPVTSDSQFNIGIYSGSCPHPAAAAKSVTPSSSSSSFSSISSSWHNQPQMRQQSAHLPSFTSSSSSSSSSSSFSSSPYTSPSTSSILPSWTAVRVKDSSSLMQSMCGSSQRTNSATSSRTIDITGSCTLLTLICLMHLLLFCHTFTLPFSAPSSPSPCSSPSSYLSVQRHTFCR